MIGHHSKTLMHIEVAVHLQSFRKNDSRYTGILMRSLLYLQMLLTQTKSLEDYENIDYTYQNSDGNTCLMLMAIERQTKLLSKLLVGLKRKNHEEARICIMRKNNEGKTILHLIPEMGSNEAVELLNIMKVCI